VLGFRLANLLRDDYLLPQAQRVAALILRDYPELNDPLLQRWLPEAPRYAYV
jgi:ATP-dependent DNA helicase RecG